MSKPTRRTVLKVVAGTAAAPVVAEASPHPAASPLTHDCDLELLELRRAIDAYQAAVRYEMSIEDSPGYAVAVAESERLHAFCTSLADAIHERTPTSMRDIALRAEVIRMHFFGGVREVIDHWAKSHDEAHEAFAYLYEAAVIVTGGSNV